MSFKKNTPKGFWTAVTIDSSHKFVFSPFFNRVYDLSDKEVRDIDFQSLLGLKGFEFAEGIVDLANQIEVNFETAYKEFTWRIYPYYLLYLFFQTFRTILPFEFLVFIIKKLNRLFFWRKSCTSLQEIGEIVGAVENKAKKPSCYPRALLTSFLCRLNNFDCNIYIGILAPSNLLHSWCCVGNKIPYEGFCEHFLYQPLLVRSLISRKNSR